MSLKDRLNALRQLPEFAAAGSKWTREEDARVVELVEAGQTIDEVAVECKRTKDCIRRRLCKLALSMVDYGESQHVVCARLALNHEDIDLERARQEAKALKKTQPPETFKDVLKDIRDTLRRIESNSASGRIWR